MVIGKESVIKIEKKQAENEWKNYREVLKNRNEKYLQEMYECFSQMKRGRKLLDVFLVMKEIGLNDKEQPKLAIANCTWKSILFQKEPNGRGIFCKTEFNPNWHKITDEMIDCPIRTFPEWSYTEERQKGNRNWIAKKLISANIPVIPAQFLPRAKNLKDYYILWEVQNWEDIPQRKDPILLKRLSNNIFAILAVWKLSKLEQSIIRGR